MLPQVSAHNHCAYPQLLLFPILPNIVKLFIIFEFGLEIVAVGWLFAE
jgi:hypothetical protein